MVLALLRLRCLMKIASFYCCVSVFSGLPSRAVLFPLESKCFAMYQPFYSVCSHFVSGMQRINTKHKSQVLELLVCNNESMGRVFFNEIFQRLIKATIFLCAVSHILSKSLCSKLDLQRRFPTGGPQNISKCAVAWCVTGK